MTKHLLTRVDRGVIVACILFSGCQSGLYKVSTSEDGKSVDNAVRYYEVTRECYSNTTDFIRDKGASPDGVLYDEDRMPIEIVEGRSDNVPDKPGWSGVLWMFTLGIFPMCQSEYMTQDVTVKSPIGEKSGSYRIDAKRWIGWIPLFVGYPGAADERDAEAKLPNRRLEGVGKDRLIKNLVGQFSYKDYVSFAKAKNNERKSEIARIKDISQRVNNLVTGNKFDDALTLIDSESKTRTATQECDKKLWADMREHANASRQAYDKKRVESLIASGKFEEAIAFCDGKNSLPINVKDELKNMAVNKAVKDLNDAKRLVSFLKLIKEVGLRDDVVMKLNDLKALAQLPKEQLVEIANTSSREDVVLATVETIGDNAALTSLLNKKHGARVLKAILEKIADAEAVRAKIWDEGDEDKLIVYVSVFGTDDECSKLIKTYPSLLTDAVVQVLKPKVVKNETKAALEELQTLRIAHEIAGLKGTNLIARVCQIKDKDIRTKTVLRIIDEMRSDRKVTAYPKIDAKEFVGLSREERKAKFKKIRFQQIAENRHRRAWSFSNLRDALEYRYSYGEERERKYECLDKEDQDLLSFLQLLRLIPQDKFTEIALSIKSNASERINFEGFYIGMSVADYIVISQYSGFKPDTNRYGSNCGRLVFNRTLRYKMFEKEDGEFWPAFMRKYIPVDKNKSIGESLSDAIGSGAYSYQEGYDDALKERCYIYKSLKFGTRVLFGLESGTLVLEEYK